MKLPLLDKVSKIALRQRTSSQQQQQQQHDSPSSLVSSTPPAAADSTPPTPTLTTGANGNKTEPATSEPARPIPVKLGTPTRPSLPRSSSDDKRLSQSSSPVGASPQRRGSWFSNISSKFSSGTAQSPPQATTTQPKPAELSVPKANPAKNAVLQHASKNEGEGPYTPAPPRSSAQAGIMHVFRRLSISNGNLNPNVKPHNHGLVERRVLNVDQHRERCEISGLNQAKLRRVAFCVDVEIAPMPKYAEESCGKKLFDRGSDKGDKDQKRKIKEKGEGEALRRSKDGDSLKESEEGETKATTPTASDEALSKESSSPKSKKESTGADKPPKGSEPSTDNQPPGKNAADMKKKEKKKKSEEERKARKEKKRKLAEANGTIPMEIHMDSDSSLSDAGSAAPRHEVQQRTQAMPTINPVRIYRRCCQLRETPILKKITEQLSNPANSSEPGMVDRLDLTGYWMQLADLVTLGDYLAIVPVKEVILENCGLADEGLRVILAGLLAARKVAVAAKKRRPLSDADGLTSQGGVVERLVLKNNKLGPEGWKHVCLFVYLCRTLKCLDLSGVPFPQPQAGNGRQNGYATTASGQRQQMDLCHLLAKSLGERLGGSTLGLLSLGETGLNTEQLGTVVDGVIKCGIKRLGLAHNNIRAEGLEHVARFLRSGISEGLDLGGNDLRDQLGVLADALMIENEEDCPLWALSLADCNLTPSSLCKLLPKLVKLSVFRFIDLSHNHELFSTNPSAISVLRRYLPKMPCLKRIHLADCGLSTEQAIALAEILPEVSGLAHVSFMENPQLVELATNANTEETKEEACALFASLLAAARVSSSLVAIDIEVPSEQSSDLVKAMAKQVVAHCLYNMERLPVLPDLTASSQLDSASAISEPEYPDVLQRLVGHDVTEPYDMDLDVGTAPDDDYVIGGSGLVKALTCCLKNRGDESRRQSGEFIRDVENGIPVPSRSSSLARPSGKAKETSKHLLLSARKLRYRLQPALTKARAASGQDTHAYHRLMFLDSTLKGIIRRFEDEFPDTRESAADSAIGGISSAEEDAAASEKQLGTSLSSSTDADHLARQSEVACISDNEDEADQDQDSFRKVRPSSQLLRSNSIISLTSKAIANEEGRVLRAGHTFRLGIVKPEHYQLLSGVEMVGADPNHVRFLHELLDELHDEELSREVAEKGVVKVFQERKEYILQRLRDADPMHWEMFVESQEMARANVNVKVGGSAEEGDGKKVDSSNTGGAASPSSSSSAVVVENN
ncbi:hypothetical protein B0T17DRAFT_612701 [Bombardia bombarda]|uniref:Cell wall biogenesis protein Mhp1 n=1 Tax=Bombardia bombarda TaxID=252184 RepID=A0AA39XKX3_9PEZI|nr:hypothetical protein B0T17DRAFT_612701 [Bombardia bombarda]